MPRTKKLTEDEEITETIVETNKNESEDNKDTISETETVNETITENEAIPESKTAQDVPAKEAATTIEEAPAPTKSAPAHKAAPRKRAAKTKEPSILTIDVADTIETQEDRDSIVWHELQNAYRTKKILSGTLDAIEDSENGMSLAVVYYKEFRVVIPVSEMMIVLADDPKRESMTQRQSKIIGNMLGAEIDFLIKGMDPKTHSIVASRKEAMIKKRQTFYMSKSTDGAYKIFEGRIVQARVIAVAEKVIRVEVFGVECPIYARDISWDWLGDMHDYYNVGDKILVRIQQISRDNPDSLEIKADIKSIHASTMKDKLSGCKLQSKYAGVVTDVHNGMIFMRLSNGVNAIAHTCYDSRTPNKRDEVSFVLTRINSEQDVAMGIVTRIIKQNL